MDTASQQKILGYFIEEAKEHLETLEQGILDLSSLVEDPESVNEMFRAAHSVKGGAAMLGYTSIQKTAHRLEDSFKILKENQVAVDQKLESLFLQAYDILKDLIERLESPSGLPQDEANEIIRAAEPNFVQLQNYLKNLVSGEVEEEEEIQPAPRVATPAPAPAPKSAAVPVAEIKKVLQQMLAIFKQHAQSATPESREQLQKLCASLANISPEQTGWQTLVKTASSAIGNPKHDYRTLAPAVLTELKRASDLMELKKAEQIAPSDGLKQLAETKLPQVTIVVEPKQAAKTLTSVFNKKQLSELVKLLQASM